MRTPMGRFGNVEDLVDAVHGPMRLVLKAQGGEQQHSRALPLAFPQEVVALFITCEAQNDHAWFHPNRAGTLGYGVPKG